MTDRGRILSAVRRGVSHQRPHPGSHPAPPLPVSWHAFSERLAAAGGEAWGPFAPGTLASELAPRIEAWADGGRVVATRAASERVGALGRIGMLPPSADASTLSGVAVAIACAELGVAESGAVAVLEEEAALGPLLFLAERVVLLLDLDRLVGDLHSAFAQLPETARSARRLLWICGPSKTADIEQTLVFGAHGPRALAVVAVDDRTA